MALSTERMALVSDMVCAALEAKTIVPGGDTEQRAKEIAEAFRIIAEAVEGVASAK